MGRRLRKEVKVVAYSIMAVALTAHYIWYTNDLKERTTEMEPIIIEAHAMMTKPAGSTEPKTTDILVTNYYYGDGSSGKVTASGKKISDFQVNDKGMYTYEGMIVIATANQNRLNREINEGFIGHNLYEVLTLEIEGTKYEAIVLDVCGACYGVEGETKQRYDVFTTGNVIGKVNGKVYETSIQD